MKRRHFISIMAAGTVSAAYVKLGNAFALPLKTHRYQIAVIDLMILKRQKISALPLAREIGADGLEIDMGGLGNRETFDNKLADPQVRQQYLDKAKELNLTFCSLAMTGFYAQSFAKREGVEKMVGDCIQIMQQMNIKVAFLPLGIQGDLTKNPELRPLIVERLKLVAPLAEKTGVIIGIETALSAAEEVKLLKDVGSKAIQIYFNFSNALEAGRDVSEELRILGKNRICQIHCTDKDGVWLENNTRLDMHKVKKTLDQMGWKGWLVIERSRDAAQPQNVKGNYAANTAYMKSVFQTK
ncbi:sugar phosphate isomerase/epimerase [Dyadobacter sp. CY343]|uniref:sugar phosphate isomerase/epimerase family protein n=1 Tax=Dyadobacter sp. CY343 TaxID=2907299 RepID=UPI001F1C3056|nr:sugar phosphate isomerase/epimerase family protein [Dyadobacter sp. CY343]MCE7060189.1 sugar phosphate isomerase/epimerase [Dyadobacter sp. CY343]